MQASETVSITENTMLYSTHYHTIHLTIQHNSIIFVLEPSNGIRLTDFLCNTNFAPAVFAFSNSSTWPGKNDIEVHYPLEHMHSANIKRYRRRKAND